ncbi:TIGR04255 family protein [Kribbella italica]|uniref:Uncharacterized protein (TIGR04255 family) n=1 Tax=Kribbella italica TaxID=1540520 RepID=A0A7W9MXT6_9ACTN|nr:TIGR04255 family protein [Kribbella italica]MBB5839700.1 uncharacterized protein (TIGR04255 family) [Kribbella italica]
MAEHRPFSSGTHYAKAPIVEAILEFQVESPLSDLDELLPLADRLEGWSDATHDYLLASEVALSPAGAEVASPQHVAHIFSRADQARTLHAALDRCAYSWGANYETWEELASEAVAAWEVYRDLAKPTHLRRIGTRFVNVIDIPSTVVEIKDYLRTSVDISPYLPQALEGFFMQVEVPLDYEHQMGVKISSTIALAPPGSTRIVLDLDTYKRCNLDLQGADLTDRLWSELSTLREAKDYVFEACITDATRGLIR